MRDRQQDMSVVAQERPVSGRRRWCHAAYVSAGRRNIRIGRRNEFVHATATTSTTLAVQLPRGASMVTCWPFFVPIRARPRGEVALMRSSSRCASTGSTTRTTSTSPELSLMVTRQPICTWQRTEHRQHPLTDRTKAVHQKGAAVCRQSRHIGHGDIAGSGDTGVHGVLLESRTGEPVLLVSRALRMFL